MSKLSSSNLSKMSMPRKKSPLDDVAVMELELEPSDGSDEESDESSDDVSNEMAGETEGETDGPLADASDDDLLAEVRRRGLSAEAEKASGDEPTSDSEY